MEAKNVTQNTAYLTISYVGQKILSFFYFVFVARMIGVEDLGKYTFALSFTTLFSVFIDWGLTQTLIRESAKYKDKTNQYLASILGVKAILAVLTYAVVVVVINLMGYTGITRNLVYLAGILMVIDQFTLTFWGLFRGQRNLKYESISVIINQAIILIFGITVLYLHLSLYFLMLPFILGSTFSLLFSMAFAKKSLGASFCPEFNWRVFKFLLGIAIPFALISIFSRVYGSLDSVMLSKMVGDKAVGWYSVAMKIPFALQFIPAALAAAIFPAFSHNFVHDKEQLKNTFDRVMRFLTIIVLPISLGVAILAKPIILFFYGEQYLPAAWPLTILMLGLFFVFVNFPLGSLLSGCDRQVLNTKLVGVTMIINIILNIILIPKYSFTGASLAFLASHSFLFIISMIYARQIIKYDLKELGSSFLRALISSLIMAGTLYFIEYSMNVVLAILVGGIVYTVFILIFKGITKDDINYFINFFRKKKALEYGPDNVNNN